MKIKPMLHRVLVKPDTLDEDPTFKAAKKAGIIFAPTEEIVREEQRMDTGVVIDIGPTAFLAFLREAGGGSNLEKPVKVGDRVSFAKYAGKAMMCGENRLIVMNDEDIVAVLETGNE